MRNKITLSDVARVAHVSLSSASKALNDSGRLSQTTRNRVQQAARELGYRKSNNVSANQSAPSRNASQRSGLIGIITSDHNGRFALPMLSGAERTLRASHRAALLMLSQGVPAIERSHIDRLIAQGVEGLILAGDTGNIRAPLANEITNQLHVVYAYEASVNPEDCSVVCDNVGAGRQAIEYLIGMGRSNIAVIGGNDSFRAVQDRSRGALDAFRLAGLQPLCMLNDYWSEEWGERAARLLIERYEELDAVYCLSDEIARGCARALAAFGFSVPQDIAVLGHDNWEYVCLNAHPTLTTFDNNIELVGRKSAQLLLDKIHGKTRQGTTTVECTLVRRESTDAHIHNALHGSGWRIGLEN